MSHAAAVRRRMHRGGMLVGVLATAASGVDQRLLMGLDGLRKYNRCACEAVHNYHARQCLAGCASVMSAA